MLKRAKKFWAALALLSVELIVIALFFFIALTGFVYLTRYVFVKQNNALDERMFAWAGGLVSPVMNDFMKGVTFFGTHSFLIPANLILIAYFLFIRRHRWYSIRIPAIALSSLGLMAGLKNLFGRSRPLIPLLEEARGLSFPSGHALMSVTFYGLMIYIVWKTWKPGPWRTALVVALVFWILIIGFSRIYLRVHYATDVLAGFAMGFLWLIISLRVLSYFERFSRKEVAPVIEEPAAGTQQPADELAS